MTAELSTNDRRDIDEIVTSLEAAWNASDAQAFASRFAEDADFVNVRAEHHRGRATIAAGHEGILKTIYAGSVNHYTLDSARLLDHDLALVHVRAELDVPGGPLAGRNCALFSMVMRRAEPTWEIVAFHNTMEPPAQPRR